MNLVAQWTSGAYCIYVKFSVKCLRKLVGTRSIKTQLSCRNGNMNYLFWHPCRNHVLSEAVLRWDVAISWWPDHAPQSATHIVSRKLYTHIEENSPSRQPLFQWESIECELPCEAIVHWDIMNGMANSPDIYQTYKHRAVTYYFGTYWA